MDDREREREKKRAETRGMEKPKESAYAEDNKRTAPREEGTPPENCVR